MKVYVHPESLNIMTEIEKRKIMYHMLMAIENDLVVFLQDILSISDIPNHLLKVSSDRLKKPRNITEILQQLDLADFIEIINFNSEKTGLKSNEFDFLNNYCSETIVAIRNRVMHPKPLLFNDYVLLENTFNNLPDMIKTIIWPNVISAQKDIKNEPEKVIHNEHIFASEVIENIPELNCEEIQFVGRRKEIKELTKNLLDDKKPIVSVVAAGGYGKTALVLKVLNDLKKGNCPFDLIVWTSFKTKQLDKTSFVDINDSISSIKGMNEFLAKFLNPKSENIQNELIEISKNFKTLLVLDNLETIASEDVFEFLKEFSVNGKVLITSRVSLGQLDLRYDLLPLNENDLLEFSNLLISFYKLDERFTNDEVRDLCKNVLFSNPLSIKWAIRCLAKGLTIDDIKNSRHDVVSFCMSNVYENVNRVGQRILHLLAFSNTPLSKGQIYFYLQSGEDDIPVIDDALAQLTSACFIDKSLMKTGKYTVIEQAKIFIDTLPEFEGLKYNFKNKKKQLKSIYQSLGVQTNQNKFDLCAINIFDSSDNNMIAAFYLYKAVELIKARQNSEALKLISMAEKASPSYFECYKIHALVLSYDENEDSLDMYEKALTCCTSSIEKSIVYCALSNHYIRSQQYTEAFESINEALILNNEAFLNLEKVKILNYSGKFNASFLLLDEIEAKFSFNPFERKLFLTRKADTIRRDAELLNGKTQVDVRRKKLYDAFMLLERENQYDDYMLEMQCKITDDLLHIKCIKSYEKEVVNLLLAKYEQVRNLSGFPQLKGTLKRTVGYFDISTSNLIFQNVFGVDITKFNIKTEGYISYVKENFVFVVNSFFRNGLYFETTGYKIGEIVKIQLDEENHITKIERK